MGTYINVINDSVEVDVKFSLIRFFLAKVSPSFSISLRLKFIGFQNFAKQCSTFSLLYLPGSTTHFIFVPISVLSRNLIKTVRDHLVNAVSSACINLNIYTFIDKYFACDLPNQDTKIYRK